MGTWGERLGKEVLQKDRVGDEHLLVTAKCDAVTVPLEKIVIKSRPSVHLKLSKLFH